MVEIYKRSIFCNTLILIVHNLYGQPTLPKPHFGLSKIRIIIDVGLDLFSLFFLLLGAAKARYHAQSGQIFMCYKENIAVAMVVVVTILILGKHLCF